MSPFRLFSRWRIAPFPSALPFRRIRVIHTRTRDEKPRILLPPPLETKINDSFSLGFTTTTFCPMPVSYLEEAFSETWIYTKDDRSLRDVFLSPRHKSYGEKLCVHEIKVMYRSRRFETKVNRGTGAWTFVYRLVVYRVWGERNFKKSSRVYIRVNAEGVGGFAWG